MTASIETPLALFQKPVKVLRFDPVVLAHLTLGEALGVIDSPMMKIGHIERIVGAKRIGIHDAVRLNLLHNVSVRAQAMMAV